MVVVVAAVDTMLVAVVPLVGMPLAVAVAVAPTALELSYGTLETVREMVG
jgi:hypothetical protein